MIVFDLDGTLVDSAPEIAVAMEHAFCSVVPGEAFPRERFRIGPPLLETIARLSPALSDDQRVAIAAAFRARYDASDFSATVPYPGVSEALELLAARGASLGIATNKRRGPTLSILDRWFPHRFSRVACVDGVWPDDGTRPGAKVAMLVWLAARAGAAVDSAVMIGDTTADVAAARAAGMRAIAVTWGYEDAATLSSAGPDELVNDVASLLSALDSKGK